MRQGRKAIGVAVAAIAVAAVAVPVGGASASHHKPPPPKPVTVKLKDSFYSPSKLSVKKDGKIVWKWVSSNTQTHNVTLESAPKGVKKSQFDSNNASSDFTFKTKFTKPGKYHFECTLHPTTMQADVTVKN
jgi:plastocyanin